MRRETIPYQCERLHNGQPIAVDLASFSVPRCGHCGELVFDYEAEEQLKEELAKKSSAIDLSALEKVSKDFEHQEVARREQ